MSELAIEQCLQRREAAYFCNKFHCVFLGAFPWDSQSTHITCAMPVTVPHFTTSGPIDFYLCIYIDIVVDGKAAVRKVLVLCKLVSGYR